MSFRDSVFSDIQNVFLNQSEYGEKRTVIYDGRVFQGIPVVISGLEERDRRQLSSDHAQGLYQVSHVLHCDIRDLDGVQPKKGQRIRINEAEGSGFFREYYVAFSVVEMGMLRAELEGIDE